MSRNGFKKCFNFLGFIFLYSIFGVRNIFIFSCSYILHLTIYFKGFVNVADHNICHCATVEKISVLTFRRAFCSGKKAIVLRFLLRHHLERCFLATRNCVELFCSTISKVLFILTCISCRQQLYSTKIKPSFDIEPNMINIMRLWLFSISKFGPIYWNSLKNCLQLWLGTSYFRHCYQKTLLVTSEKTSRLFERCFYSLNDTQIWALYA